MSADDERFPMTKLADIMNRPRGETADADTAILIDLVKRGVLIGVEVFGENDCCEHGMHTPCPSDGFGLCDQFGPHSVGSDCNRAEAWLLRPNDDCMTWPLLEAMTNENPDAQPNAPVDPVALLRKIIGDGMGYVDVEVGVIDTRPDFTEAEAAYLRPMLHRDEPTPPAPHDPRPSLT